MIYRADIEVTTPLNPTEVEDRVERAITNIFPGARVEERHGELAGEAHSLDRLRERLREQEIVATAREVFRRNREGEVFTFDLKKQAAFVGVVNFSVGNPDELGDIHVRVRVEEPDAGALIDHIAPAVDEE